MNGSADVPDRRCFLQHFVICLAFVAGAMILTLTGVPQAIWATDLSYMTSVVAAIVLFATLYIGAQSWRIGPQTSAYLGVYLMFLCPLVGLFGTATGLRANTAALAQGTSGLTALGTSLTTMQVGVLGLILISMLVYNLETGIRRYEAS